jgi:hypothetical protein
MSEKLSREPAGSSIAKSAASPLADATLSMRGLGVTIVRVSIIGGFFLLWEIASDVGRTLLISSPVGSSRR